MPSIGGTGGMTSGSTVIINRAQTYLDRWFAGGLRGKKMVLVGDSTSEFAYGLHRALQHYYTRRGRELEGVAVLNYGINGNTLSGWLADTTTRYGKTGTIAANADLYVLSYGINDIRTGAVSEDGLYALLLQAIDALVAGVPGTTILLRVPPTFTTTNTGGYNFISPNTPADAQTYSTLMRNAYLRAATARNLAMLDSQSLVFGLTSQADTLSPYMLNQIHPNDLGNIAVARELVKMTGGVARSAPLTFSAHGRVTVGILGRYPFPAPGRIALGYATYKPSAAGGSLTLEFRKINGGTTTVLGTATYSGGTGSTNVFAGAASLYDWSSVIVGDQLEVAVTACTVTTADLDVSVLYDDALRSGTYPLVLRPDGLRNSLDNALVYSATQPLNTAQERDIRGLKALTVKRLGYNRIRQYSQDASKSNWVNSNVTVTGTAGAQTLTATATNAVIAVPVTAVTPGEQLTWSWKATPTGGPKFGVYDLTNAAWITGPTLYSALAADGNGYRTVTVTAPAGCTTIRCYPVANVTTIGDSVLFNDNMVSSGAAALPSVPTNNIGTSMVVNTGALPSEFTLITLVKVDGFAAGQVSVVSPGGPNTDGNPALQSVTASGLFGYPVVATRGTVTRGANGSWQPAVLRATGGNVYVTTNDQAQSPAYSKAVNATDLRLNLVNATDTTGSFQNWDGEVIQEYYPYLLTEGEAATRVKSLLRMLLAAGETVSADWPAQRLI